MIHKKKLKYFVEKFGKKNIFLLIIFITLFSFLELIGIASIFPLVKVISDPEMINELEIVRRFNLNLLSQTQIVVYSLLSFGTIYFFKSCYAIFLVWFNATLLFKIQMRLSKELYNHYLFSSYLFHKNVNTSELVRNVKDEVSNLVKNLFVPCIVIISELLILSSIIFFLIYLNPLIILILVSFFSFFGILFYSFANKRIKTWGELKLIWEKTKLMNLFQSFSSIKDIKLSRTENFFTEKFFESAYLSGNQFRKNSILSSLPRYILEFFFIAIIIFYFYTNFKNGISLISILPILAVYVAAAYRVLPSFLKLYSNFQMIKFSYPTMDKLYQEFLMPNEKKLVSKKGSKKLNFDKKIELKNISFKYPDSINYVLNNLNLVVKKGSSIGIIGASGEGKSTIIDILLGLLKPDKGKVLCDRENINGNLYEWYSKIGHIPQDVFILDDTLEANIAFGKNKGQFSKESFVDTINNSQLSKFINQIKKKKNKNLGERGLKISGGEKQRIGIARALYKYSEILVFDECTSALDFETEKKILRLINSLRGKKTLIIISHKKNIFNLCDHVYILKNQKLKKINKI